MTRLFRFPSWGRTRSHDFGDYLFRSRGLGIAELVGPLGAPGLIPFDILYARDPQRCEPVSGRRNKLCYHRALPAVPTLPVIVSRLDDRRFPIHGFPSI